MYVHKGTTLSARAGVHRVRRRADDHDAPYRIHGREHAHARAHVRGCGFEPIRACVHGCGGAYESENLSWVVLLSDDFLP